jgi:hypothetical protein
MGFRENLINGRQLQLTVIVCTLFVPSSNPIEKRRSTRFIVLFRLGVSMSFRLSFIQGKTGVSPNQSL